MCNIDHLTIVYVSECVWKEGDINFYRLLNFLFSAMWTQHQIIPYVIFPSRDSFYYFLLLFVFLYVITIHFIFSFFLHCHDYSAIAVAAYSLWDRYRPSIEFDVEFFFSRETHTHTQKLLLLLDQICWIKMAIYYFFARESRNFFLGFFLCVLSLEDKVTHTPWNVEAQKKRN